MKIKILRKKTCFIDDPAIESFHSCMFHGVPERFGDVEAHRMQVNAFNLHQIIMTKVKLVVSEAVRALLVDVPGLFYSPIEFTKVVSIRYAEFDFWHWDDPRYSDDGTGPERVFAAAGHRHDLLAGLPRFYEVECPRLWTSAVVLVT